MCNIENLIKKSKKKISNNKWLAIFFIVTFIFTLYLDAVVLLLRESPMAAIPGMATISDRILFLTSLALLWYAWETRKMKNEMTTQTELELKPIFMMNIRDYSKNEDMQIKQKEYRVEIDVSNSASKFYVIRIRNVGKGPAFNVEVKDENGKFKVEKYQSQFFAPEPKGDEQSIKIVRKNGEEIQNYDEFKGVTFKIKCDNASEPKHTYYFKYKIIDIGKQRIEYLG